MSKHTIPAVNQAEADARRAARQQAATKHGQGGNSVPALRERLDTVETAIGIVPAANK